MTTSVTLATDIAQIEREQRADEDAERHGAADFPGEAREAGRRRRSSSAPTATRANSIANEKSTRSDEIGEHDDRQHRLAESASRARSRW